MRPLRRYARANAAAQQGLALVVAGLGSGSPLDHKRPALAAIEQRNRAAAPMPAAVRERLNQIKKGA